MARSNRTATAKPSKAAAKAEESEIDYEVERIVEHDRKRNGLQYKVAWMGYPLPEDDTWQPADSLDSAPEIVEAYWESVPDKKKHERYAAGSKQAKAAQAAAASSPVAPAATVSKAASKSRSPSVRNGSTPALPTVTNSRKRVAVESAPTPKANKRGKKVIKEPTPEVEAEGEIEAEVEAEVVAEEDIVEEVEEVEEIVEEVKEKSVEKEVEEKEEEKMEVDDEVVEEKEEPKVVEDVVKAKPVAVKNGGKKEVKKATPPPVETQKVVEPVVEEKADEVEEEVIVEKEEVVEVAKKVEEVKADARAEDSDSSDEDLGPHPLEIKYKDLPSWEILVDKVETMARASDDTLTFTVVWAKDKSKCQIPLQTARAKFPQKMIDLFVSRVQFKVVGQDDDDDDDEDLELEE